LREVEDRLPVLQQPQLPDVDTSESVLPPFLGARAMTEDLAANLNGLLATLHEKRSRAKGFYAVVSISVGIFALMSIAVIFSAPLLGIMMLMVFAVAGCVLLLTPLGIRCVTSLTDIDMDLMPERKFLAELRTTEVAVEAAVTAWGEHLRKIQSMRNDLAKESALVKKTNEQIRQANARAANWNQRRVVLITAVQEEQKKNVASLRQTLEAFVAKYPSLRQWWTLPEEPRPPAGTA